MGGVPTFQGNHMQRSGKTGVALTVYCFFGIFAIGAEGPVDYLINFYQLLFGIVVCLLEASDDLRASSPHLTLATAKVHEHAYFLTLLAGRGAFYIFVLADDDAGEEPRRGLLWWHHGGRLHAAHGRLQ